MKRKLLWALTAILAVGLMVSGCSNGSTTPTPPETPDYGTNLVTEEAILAATGTGGTAVEKVAGGYEVTGTVTAYSNWDNSINDNRIVLNIQADPDDLDAYFAEANRYGIKINFPDSEVKPIEEYTEGFRIYLENSKATDSTAQWAGTWQHEWADEYNAIGGVGTMTIDRDLSVDGDGDEAGSEVGDYQHLVLVLAFDDEHLGEEYTFTISDVAVYGEEVKGFAPQVETPVIHGSSQLLDATYQKDATPTNLKVVPEWTDNSSTYTYLWYSNTSNATTGGTAITNATTDTFTPPTDTVGIVYYYCVVTYPTEETSATTRAVKITVTEEEVVVDPNELGGEFTYVNDATQKGWVLTGATWTAFESAKYLILETYIDPETDPWGFGGLQIILQGAGDPNNPNWAATETVGWVNCARKGKTVYVVIDLSVLTDYATFKTSGDGGKIILGVYPELAGLGVQNAYLTPLDLEKPVGAIDWQIDGSDPAVYVAFITDENPLE